MNVVAGACFALGIRYAGLITLSSIVVYYSRQWRFQNTRITILLCEIFSAAFKTVRRGRDTPNYGSYLSSCVLYCTVAYNGGNRYYDHSFLILSR
jgi:hypothetical protein